MKRRYLAAIVFILFILTAVSFAASSTFTLNLAAKSQPVAAPATTAGKYGNAPDWSPMADTTGTVTVPGDLFIADASVAHSDNNNVQITLYWNNPYSLSRAYTYLNENISIYKWDVTLNSGQGGWQSTVTATDVLSLDNGYVTFNLPGGNKYCISIDGGNYFCKSTTDGSVTPAYILQVRY